jgi:hypothetical protein
VFDALTAPGAELPTGGSLNVPNVKSDLFNAHISVMTADEVASIGANKINERGHLFHYGLGPLIEIAPKTIDGISKIWAVQVVSPALSALRKSYGLPPLVHGDHQFHITVAVRRTKVLQNNGVSKFERPSSRGELKAAADLLPGGTADNLSDREFSAAALAEGLQHEQEHTNNDQIAKEIAKDHLQEDRAYYKKMRLPSRAKKVAASNNAYWDQLQATPLQYDGKRTVLQNALGHAQRVKDRGDQQLTYQASNERFKRYFNPAYAQQQMLRDIGAQPARPLPWKTRANKAFEAAIQRYGTQTLNKATQAANGGL